jgi:hypothetical protein
MMFCVCFKTDILGLHTVTAVGVKHMAQELLKAVILLRLPTVCASSLKQK